MTATATANDPDAQNIALLLEGVYRKYGLDFRDYAFASLKRRISTMLQAEHLRSVAELQERVLHDPACMERFLLVLSVNTTGMFRDPGFYVALRAQVVPHLRTYPFLR